MDEKVLKILIYDHQRVSTCNRKEIMKILHSKFPP